MKLETRVTLRLPSELKCWLLLQCDANGASLNSEIVRAIRERMERLNPTDQAAAA